MECQATGVRRESDVQSLDRQLMVVQGRIIIAVFVCIKRIPSARASVRPGELTSRTKLYKVTFRRITGPGGRGTAMDCVRQ